MRKKWKRSFVTALSVALAVGNCVPAMAASTGWKQTAAGWQYVNSNGSVQKGWFQDTDGKWYFLDYNTGVMKNGWIKPKDGKWYFMDYHTGAMKTGWIKPKDGKWYYLGASGDMKTGWLQTADGKYYYLDAASGAMQTGTITVNNQVWTLDANGVWDGKAASSVTYVSSGRPSSGGGSSSSTKDEWSKGGITVKKVSGGYDVTITKADITVDKAAINAAKSGAADKIQNLTISEKVEDGKVTLDGITVKGETKVLGGGAGTIIFNNCKLEKKLTTNKTKGKELLRLLFTGSTEVEDIVAEGNTVKIESEGTDVTVKSITVKTSIIVANITITQFIIDTAIKAEDVISLNNVVVKEKFEVNASNVNIKVDGNETVLPEIVGTGKDDMNLTGDANVSGYYTVKLDANGGYWEIKDPNAKEENAELIHEEVRNVKIKTGESANTVLGQKDFENPISSNKDFTKWYTDKECKTEADLTNITDSNSTDVITLYAGWSDKEVAAPIVKEVSVTVSGAAAALKGKVENKAAIIVVPNATTGSAITVSKINATATVDGKDVTAEATTAPSTVTVGKDVDLTFKFGTQEVTIKVTFTTN